jgi:hypothetical protein
LNNFIRFLKDYQLLATRGAKKHDDVGFLNIPKKGTVLEYRKVTSERA